MQNFKLGFVSFVYCSWACSGVRFRDSNFYRSSAFRCISTFPPFSLKQSRRSFSDYIPTPISVHTTCQQVLLLHSSFPNFNNIIPTISLMYSVILNVYITQNQDKESELGASWLAEVQVKGLGPAFAVSEKPSALDRNLTTRNDEERSLLLGSHAYLLDPSNLNN